MFVDEQQWFTEKAYNDTKKMTKHSDLQASVGQIQV